MPASYRYLRLWLSHAGLWPTSKAAVTAWYLLALDALLALLRVAGAALKLRVGTSLGGWVEFLSIVVAVLFLILALRWIKAKVLWRLRNRLIVTYVFIGVIPVVLLVALALGSLYLFAGQFATFIVTSELNAELKSLEASNAAVAHHVAAELRRGPGSTAALESLRRTNKAWAGRQVHVWLNKQLILSSTPAGEDASPPVLSEHVKAPFSHVVRDHDKLHLRAIETVQVPDGALTVLSSQPFDQHMLENLAADFGEVTLFATGLRLSKVDEPKAKHGVAISVREPDKTYVLDTGERRPPTYSVGTVPPPTRRLDREVTFPTTILVFDWETGDTSAPALINVQTRFSKLYERLFAALGDLAPLAKFVLFTIAIFFAVIEVVALIVGARLTRTMTGAVAQLYDATIHINRGDFSHRIPVKSNDQIATLANSFNSMTASLEKLIEEQKEKQRMENELAIAQEVQAQLFPRQISQLASLEVHGFCRPARTVSGDYYDFLTLSSSKLVLAVGDISGKGISAALLMATIHSAVRAYSLDRVPGTLETASVGAAAGPAVMLASNMPADASPAALLAMLNHHLYESTPPEKYATLFLGIYDGAAHKLTYSNGGHLPPIVMSEDGTVRRLEAGGTVVGLFDQQSYGEGSIQLRSGDIFVAFSDGVTEPENDFGEFGEQRLIDLISENRMLPLPRISEIVTAAVDDWIGANEQPDDVTLVLARAR